MLVIAPLRSESCTQMWDLARFPRLHPFPRKAGWPSGHITAAGQSIPARKVRPFFASPPRAAAVDPPGESGSSLGRQDVEIHRLTVRELVSGEKWIFSTKGNMRLYEWKREHCDELVESIFQTSTESPGPTGTRYEIGAEPLLVVPKTAPDGNALQMMLADGQQRIITILLLLAAMRDLMKDLTGASGAEGNANANANDKLTKLANDLDGYFFLEANFVNRQEETPKVSVRNKNDTKVLHAILRGPGAMDDGGLVERKRDKSFAVPKKGPLSDQAKRFIENYNTLLARMREMFHGEEAAEELAKFYAYMMMHCTLMVCTTNNRQEAFRMIKGQGRGMDQEAVDMFKAMIVLDFNAGEEDQDECERLWDKMQEGCGPEKERRGNLTGSLLHLAALDGMHRPIRNQELKVMEQWFFAWKNEKDSSPSLGLDFVESELCVKVQQVRHVVTGQYPISEELGLEEDSQVALQVLSTLHNTVGVKEWVPVVLFLINNDRRGCNDIFRILEAVALYHIVCKPSVGVRYKAFMDILSELRSGSQLQGLSTEQEAELQSALASSDLGSNIRGAKAVLVAMNAHYNMNENHAAGLPFGDSLTVEHVLPKKPKEGTSWQAAPWTAEERERCLQGLGNLALVNSSKNARISNACYSIKQDFMKSNPSHIPLTTRAFAAKQWTPEVCDENLKFYISLCSRWTGSPASP